MGGASGFKEEPKVCILFLGQQAPPWMIAKRPDVHFVLFSLISSRNGGVANAFQLISLSAVALLLFRSWLTWGTTYTSKYGIFWFHWEIQTQWTQSGDFQSVCKWMDDSAHLHVFIIVRHWHSASTASGKCQQWHVLFFLFSCLVGVLFFPYWYFVLNWSRFCGGSLNWSNRRNDVFS